MLGPGAVNQIEDRTALYSILQCSSKVCNEGRAPTGLLIQNAKPSDGAAAGGWAAAAASGRALLLRRPAVSRCALRPRPRPKLALKRHATCGVAACCLWQQHVEGVKRGVESFPPLFKF